MRNFRNYEVYQNSMTFVTNIYTITKSFPEAEKFGLTNQLRRAAVSVPSNIAEGASRKSEKEFSRFIEIALGSCFEIETQLTIATNLNYISKETIPENLNMLTSIQKQLNGFRNKLIG